MLEIPMPETKIASLASYVPETVVENAYFETRYKLKPGTILKKTGLRSRRYAQPDEYPTSMGLLAARKAINNAELDAEAIDLLISAGTSRDQSIPPDAMIYAHKLGIPDVQCIHVEAVCLSFLNAMEIADFYISSGKKQAVLLISAEKTSKVINYDDPSSSILLGDGAAAVVLCPGEGNSKILASSFKTEALGKNIEVAHLKAGGLKNHPFDDHFRDEMTKFTVNGPLEFKLAVKYIPDFLKSLLEDAGHGIEAFDHVIPHQVVPKMIKSILGRIGLPSDQLRINSEYGNMAAASIPVVMAGLIESGRMVRGQKILLFGGAAGFSLGGVALVY